MALFRRNPTVDERIDNEDVPASAPLNDARDEEPVPAEEPAPAGGPNEGEWVLYRAGNRGGGYRQTADGIEFVDGYFGSGPNGDDPWPPDDSDTISEPEVGEPEEPQTPPRHTTDTLLNKLVFLTAEEAANGCTKVVELPDGRRANVTIPAGIDANGHVDVPGQGRLDEGTGTRGILRLSFMITGTTATE